VPNDVLKANANCWSFLNPEEYWALESTARDAELFDPAPFGHAVALSEVVHSVTVCGWLPVLVQAIVVPKVAFLFVGL